MCVPTIMQTQVSGNGRYKLHVWKLKSSNVHIYAFHAPLSNIVPYNASENDFPWFGWGVGMFLIFALVASITTIV